MLECVQGEGGVMPLDTDFVKEAAEIAEKEDILVNNRRGTDRQRQNAASFTLI